MARVVVRYFGPLRDIVGKRSDSISIEDSATLLDLLETLAGKHGTKFRNFLFGPDGSVRDGIAFATDGDSTPSSKLQRTRCLNIEEFVILPPISGGGQGNANLSKS